MNLLKLVKEINLMSRAARSLGNVLIDNTPEVNAQKQELATSADSIFPDQGFGSMFADIHEQNLLMDQVSALVLTDWYHQAVLALTEALNGEESQLMTEDFIQEGVSTLLYWMLQEIGVDNPSIYKAIEQVWDEYPKGKFVAGGAELDQVNNISGVIGSIAFYLEEGQTGAHVRAEYGERYCFGGNER